MSNVIQRIFSNAVLFALLLSASLTVHANAKQTNAEDIAAYNQLFACDVPDQANLDFDVDHFVNVTSFKVLQPLPKDTHSLYKSSTLNRPFSSAYQRGPPSYLI